MEVYLLDSNLYMKTVVDYADSVLWLKKYNDLGEAELYMQCNADILALFHQDDYLYRPDDNMLCQIRKIQLDTSGEQGDYLTVTAVDAASILSGRIVWNTIDFNGTVPAFITRVLNENVISPSASARRIPNFRIDNSNFATLTDSISIQVSHDDVLQLIIGTCKSYNYGFRLSVDIDSRQFVFSLYKGVDRSNRQGESYIEFSEEYDNILTTHYTYDKQTEKTVALVGGQGEGSERKYATVGTGAGIVRKELWVDAKDISMTYKDAQDVERTYTNAQYTALLVERGRAKLAEYVASESFSGEIDVVGGYIYKTDYNLGDIVMVKNEYGISAATRIIEVDESDDNDNGYIIEPIFDMNGV